MIEFITIGTILGLSAGLSPGPLFTLVISETLRYGVKAGIRVSLAPVITDLPIILLCFFLLIKLSHIKPILGSISISGGFLLFYLGYENIRFLKAEENSSSPPSKSLKKGIFVNAMSPHPYLFWLSVGSPIMIRAMKHNGSSMAIFLISFYLMLIGSKICLAVATEKSRTFMSSRIFIYVIRFLGGLLLGFGIILIKNGLDMF